MEKKAQTQFLRSNRSIDIGQALEISTMKNSGIKTCQIMDYFVNTSGGYENVGFIIKDIYNFLNLKSRNLKVESDVDSALAYLSALKEYDRGLYIRHEVDMDNRLCCIFWSGSWSRMDYALFGDVLVIDSTYRTNAFKLPLVMFVGTNHHLNNIVFGCALVSEEDTMSYKWAFYTFIHVMGGKEP